MTEQEEIRECHKMLVDSARGVYEDCLTNEGANVLKWADTVIAWKEKLDQLKMAARKHGARHCGGCDA